MGVTIHFEGKLKSESDYQYVMLAAKEFALMGEMEFNFFEEENKLLQRVKNEKEWDYQGATRGIQIQPHENSDPFILEFDSENYIQEYCKTQFSDVETHARLISFLKIIEPCFDELVVFDEGEYWETNDYEVLRNRLEACFLQMEIAKEKDETLNGPFRLPSGRIIDLMHSR